MDPKAFIRVERANYVLGGVLIVITALLGTNEQALGVLCGVVISSLNFSVIRRLVSKMMSGEESERQKVATLFIPKMGILMGAVAAAIFLLPISPIYFAIGFSVFLASIAVETVRFLVAPTPNASDSHDDNEDVGS